MMVDWIKATIALKQAQHILVVSHVNPDGDAIGATLAVGFIAEALGVPVTLVNESPIPERFLFLPGADKIMQPAEVTEQFSTVIAVDAADTSRMGNCQQLFDDNVRIVNIDHHATNDHFGMINVVKADAAATVELLYDCASYLQLPFTNELATVIYTGLLTDTGGFRYSNTSPNVLRIAASLLELGVKAHLLADCLLETVSLSYLEHLKEALDTIQTTMDGKVAYLTSNTDESEVIVNYARNIDGVDVGILFLRLNEQSVKVSFRSREQIDVGSIALSLGGGGHARAAGCTINGAMEEVIQIVLGKIKKAFEEVSS
jgi:bifunctional oligoribonuclease and PAP phosphatase NrnA